ncbi:MAG TPA: hypothetical protein VF718_15415 [Allosphingosinicella sp.]
MKKSFLILLLLAGCGRGDAPPDEGNGAAPAAGGQAAGPAAPASKARLTGLYEGGTGAQKNQLCLADKGAETEFGLIVWGANLHSCSGAGVAVRSGERLTLRMTGDETCAIEATLKGGTIALPATLPTGCAYYCGARASLAGASFTRAGDDVKKATDIAGDPLCD